MFQIKNPCWADYWQQQAYAVMLVIRTSDGEIRWRDVSAYLKRESASGKTVRQIVFAGGEFDVMSVQNWRKKVPRQGSSRRWMDVPTSSVSIRVYPWLNSFRPLRAWKC
ncbi:MAG: hypothetical protein ABSC03_11285 [Verrucomicrobiota bacterium]